MGWGFSWGCLSGISSLLAASAVFGGQFRVATYNVENYRDQPAPARPVKAVEAKAAVRRSILSLKADVVALQEIGARNDLLELQSSLKSDGADFPYTEFVQGFDTNVHLAILSKFPIAARRPHTNDNFLVSGRRFRVSRGFAEVDIRVNPQYSFTLIAAHLKSKRAVAAGDETELRLEEARLLRAKVDAHLRTDPAANVVVLGDLNDGIDSASTKTLIGKGSLKLVDTRPAERSGVAAVSSNGKANDRSVAWTYYYEVSDTYSRFDYILLSPGMAREWVVEETYVFVSPEWRLASDHRPLVATIQDADK